MPIAGTSSELPALRDPKAGVFDRYNALFEAMTTGKSESDNIMCLLKPDTPSVLLRHEACFVLGQIGAVDSAAMLGRVLSDELEHEMVRHEAAEALAAMNHEEARDILKRYSTEAGSVPLQETCELGLERLDATDASKGEFNTCDPISGPTDNSTSTEADIPELKLTLLDMGVPLAKRYSAMYKLRAMMSADFKPSRLAVEVLAEALIADTSSALLRHEMAFVIGQMSFGNDGRDSKCAAALRASLANSAEHCMVRHEAAIALGSVGGPDDLEFLQAYASRPVDDANQDEAVVIESCVVAHHALTFWAQSAQC